MEFGPNSDKYLFERAKALGFEKRIKFHELLLPMKSSNRHFDLIFLSNFTHCLTFQENAELFKCLGQILSPRGRLVVKDYFIMEDRSGPMSALNFDATMAIYSHGKLYSKSELKTFGEKYGGLVEMSYQYLANDEGSFLQIFAKSAAT